MDWKTYLFDQVKSPDTLQVVFRGIIVFITAPVILRAGAKRTFGNETTLDKIVVIMLGGMLSRVVTGASAYLPVIAATTAIIIVYTAIARLSLDKHFTTFIMGRPVTVFKDNRINVKQAKRTFVCKEDLLEAARLKLNVDELSKVKEIVMERNGELSVVKKDE